jgi:hypothetical protein
MTKPLAILSLVLALGLALAAPAPGSMSDPPLDLPPDPTLAAPTGEPCPPGLRWSYRLQQCIDDGLPGIPGQPPLALPGQGAPPPPEGCPPGLRWSRSQARCVQPPPRWDCGPYFRWSLRWRRCVPLCPPGMYYSPGLNDCSPQGEPLDPDYYEGPQG